MPGAVHVSDEADDWFSKYFEMEGCKLYSYPVDGTPRYSVDKGVKVENYRNDKDGVSFIQRSYWFQDFGFLIRVKEGFFTEVVSMLKFQSHDNWYYPTA